MRITVYARFGRRIGGAVVEHRAERCGVRVELLLPAMVLASPAPVADASSVKEISVKLNHALTPALVALCRARPADPVTFLAEYLLAHKPPPPVHQPPAFDRLLHVLSLERDFLEPSITALLHRLVATYKGSALVDLEHKYKAVGSIALKFHRFVANYCKRYPELSPAQAEEAILRMHTTEPGVAGDPIIVDTMRYTLLIPTASYAAAVRELRTSLPTKEVPGKVSLLLSGGPRRGPRSKLDSTVLLLSSINADTCNEMTYFSVSSEIYKISTHLHRSNIKS